MDISLYPSGTAQTMFTGQDRTIDFRTLRGLAVKKRTWLAKGYGAFASAWRTLQGIEAVNMIRKVG
jgi:hypothetical protein